MKIYFYCVLETALDNDRKMTHLRVLTVFIKAVGQLGALAIGPAETVCRALASVRSDFDLPMSDSLGSAAPVRSAQ